MGALLKVTTTGALEAISERRFSIRATSRAASRLKTKAMGFSSPSRTSQYGTSPSNPSGAPPSVRNGARNVSTSGMSSMRSWSFAVSPLGGVIFGCKNILTPLGGYDGQRFKPTAEVLCEDNDPAPALTRNQRITIHSAVEVSPTDGGNAHCILDGVGHRLGHLRSFVVLNDCCGPGATPARKHLGHQQAILLGRFPHRSGRSGRYPNLAGPGACQLRVCFPRRRSTKIVANYGHNCNIRGMSPAVPGRTKCN